MKIKIKPLLLHDGQQEIIQDKSRFKVIRAGRRFGKTRLALFWLTCGDRNSVLWSQKPVAYFVPKYKDLIPVWESVIRIFDKIIKKANYTEKRIQFISGGEMDFWSLEQKNAGRGFKYAKIVIDEAAHSPYLEDTWQKVIRATLTDFVGECWFISTPNGMNYFYKLSCNEKITKNNKNSTWKTFHMPTSKNPFIMTSEIEEAKNSLPELVYLQEYEAEFVTFGAGLVKPEHIIEGTPRNGLPVVFGVDLAISTKDTADYTAIVIMTRDNLSGVIYIIDVQRYRFSFNDTIEKIKKLALKYNPVSIAIEQTQYQAAAIQELIRTTKLPVRGVKPDRDKISRFIPLLARYEQNFVRHSPTLPEWFKEEILTFPEGMHDDLVDAASYAYIALPTIKPGEFKVLDRTREKW